MQSSGRGLLKILSLYSGLHDHESISRYLRSFEEILQDKEHLKKHYLGAISTKTLLVNDKNVILFVVTGGTSKLGYSIVSGADRTYIVYHDEHNSIASALNIASMLKSEGKSFRLIDLRDFDSFARKLEKAVGALYKLRGSKILVVGESSQQFSYSNVIQAIREHFNVEIDFMDLSSLLEEMKNVAQAECYEKAEELLREAESSEIEKREVAKNACVYWALKRIISSKGVENIALKCFELLKELGYTGCIAVAELIRDGVIAGCEADVAATIVMRLLKEISGLDPWIGNVSGFSEEGFELSHCVISRSIVRSFRLTTHFESGKPTSIEGYLDEGAPATIVSYEPRRKLWRVIEAQVIRGRPSSSRKCRTQIVFRASRDAVREIKEDPIDGHYVMVLDNAVEEASLVGELVGLHVQQLRL